jgi:hypothetical protein
MFLITHSHDSEIPITSAPKRWRSKDTMIPTNEQL